MSVVNQMLRDLDARQAEHEALPFEPLARVAVPSRRKWIAIGAGIAVTGVAAVVIAHAPERRPSMPQVAATPTVPALQVVPAPESIQTIEQGPVEPLPAQVAAAPDRAPSPKSTTTDKRPALAQPPAAATPNRVLPPTAIAPERTDAVTLAKTRPSTPVNDAVQIEKRVSDPIAQSADAAFRRAAGFIEKGRITDAKIALNAALAADPSHAAARQTLAALLIEAHALDQAEAVLAEGLERDPAQTNFAIALARIKLERGDQPQALALLFAHRPAAANNAQYRAFLAALLQRADRHAEAIGEYQAALRLAPGVGAWWIGLGLAHEAIDRSAEAALAFRQARSTGTLNADLSDLVERRLGSAQ